MFYIVLTYIMGVVMGGLWILAASDIHRDAKNPRSYYYRSKPPLPDPAKVKKAARGLILAILGGGSLILFAPFTVPLALVYLVWRAIKALLKKLGKLIEEARQDV